MSAPSTPSVAWSCAVRALPGESVCGDVPLVVEHGGGVLVALLDGLGHGPEAARAAELGAELLRSRPGSEVQALAQACHEGMRSTRGAAMSLAQLDVSRSTLSWLGVGNVEGVLLHVDPARKAERLAPAGGVVGYRMPTLRVSSLPLERGDTLVFASDGLRSDFARGLVAGEPEELAQQVLGRSAKGNDDACVVVVRYLAELAVWLPVRHPADVAGARLRVRDLAARRGFAGVAAEELATAVSELARNALVHADGGELSIAFAECAGRRGLSVVVRDQGPGIADVAKALTDGWSSTGSLGLGLPGARRLADDFELDTAVGVGTTVTLRKWLP